MIPCTTTCRGILGVATVVLALAGVEANPKRSFDDISSGLKNGHSTRTTTTHSSGHKVIKAEIHCRSDAYASAYSDWRSSYIKAGALQPATSTGMLRRCHCPSVRDYPPGTHRTY